ncbi:MAG: response regulator [Steroidobacteraceae bacterium]|jgi:CheY-like chemotaxis protein
MGQKRALVVDDSKSARVILSRMLEKYDIEVDMAESAEQAIEYLKHGRPDAIFMDHLMPGMDGLQAVQAIKSNPQTATIPIMMYTSQEGELYVGQARALGAMGVLPKQVRPVDVSKVLYELHLLPDRRELDEPALVPVEIGSGGQVERPPAGVSSDVGRRIEAAVKQQSVDLRRFIVASLDSMASRLEADLLRPVPTSGLPPEPPAPARATQHAWPWALAILGLVLLGGMSALLWLSHRDLMRTQQELAALRSSNADLRQASEQIAATVKDLAAAVAAGAAAQKGSSSEGALADGAAPADSAAPAEGAPRADGGARNAAGVSRSEPVPYGELPFDRSRVDVLRDVLSKLEAQGFRGVVKVTSSPGIFCLTGNAADGFVPAAPNLPVSKCDVVGNPFEDSLSGQQRQSLSFANLVAGVRQRTAGAINVVTENASAPRAPAAYPPHSDTLTAGEWNRAASANNRVEYSVEPAS